MGPPTQSLVSVLLLWMEHILSAGADSARRMGSLHGAPSSSGAAVSKGACAEQTLQSLRLWKEPGVGREGPRGARGSLSVCPGASRVARTLPG